MSAAYVDAKSNRFSITQSHLCFLTAKQKFAERAGGVHVRFSDGICKCPRLHVPHAVATLLDRNA
jgi:hypothetical protein